MLRKVTVETGVVEGIPAADPRITAFKGIPYAAPPVGENRWRAPQPAKKWEGVLKAYKFAPISMQHVPGEDPDNIYSREWNVDTSIEMSEDSLMLNVWTPARRADEKLPVFVWYFGGGLREGNTAEMEFDGERLARRGIIVVTVNYRLNVLVSSPTRRSLRRTLNSPATSAIWISVSVPCGSSGTLQLSAATRTISPSAVSRQAAEALWPRFPLP